MRLPVEILVLICVAIGLFPNTVAGWLVDVSAAAAAGTEVEHHKIALWHGLNVPLLMSAIAIVGGIVAWRGRHAIIALHEGVVPFPRAKGIFDAGVAGCVALSARVTRSLENGSLQRYLGLLVAMVVLAVGVPLLTASWAPGDVAGPAPDPMSVTFFGFLIIGTLGTVALHRDRITALAFISVVGLVMSLAFVHLSAPDLALTQISVEVVTIVLLLLALHLLPERSPKEEQGWVLGRDAVLSIAAGAVVGVVSWLMLSNEVPTIADFFLAESKPGGGGYNVVNVILVDFRGYDTFGEITVLGIAALGIYAMIYGMGVPEKWKVSKPGDEVRYPLLLTIVARLTLPLSLLVSIHLFLRGHNQPGGGFIAGLVTAVALIVQYIASGIGWTQIRLTANLHRVIGVGLLLAGLTGVGAWIWGFPFLTGWFDYFHFPLLGEVELASAILFDLGVYLTVVAVVMLMLSNMGKIRNATAVDVPDDQD
jgi:multicomponent K+:H+ antiporter subunit A